MKLLLLIFFTALILFAGCIGDGEISNDIKEKCNFNNDWDGCYTDSLARIAIEKNDISLCDRGKIILGEFNEPRCFFKYLEVYLDENECKRTIANKNICYTVLAEVKNDSSICIKMFEEVTLENPEIGRDFCLEKFTGEGLSICRKMGKNTYRTSCVKYHAIKQKDITLCERFIEGKDEQTTKRDIEYCKLEVANAIN